MTINLSEDFKSARQELINSIKMASQKKHKQNYMKVCLTNYSKNLKQAAQEAEKVASLTTNDKQLNAQTVSSIMKLTKM